MRLSIFIFLLTFAFSAYAQQPTVGSDNFIIRNAAGSVSKPINMDSVTAYNARNLGNQSVIGTANDSILTTLNGQVRKVKAGTLINANNTFIANSSADTVLGVNGNVQTKLNAYQNNSTGERQFISTNGSNNNFIYDAVAYSGVVNDTGAIVLEYPVNGDYHMTTAEIDGYNYAASQNSFKIRMGFYQYNGNLFTNVGGGSVSGQFNRQVKIAYVNNHVCIIIGDTTDVWQYPKINLSKTTLSHSSPVQMINGWSSRITKTFVGYTQLTPIPLNASFTSNADTSNILLQSVSSPSTYFTKLTNQYNAAEPFILQNGSTKILGSKTINSVGSTYLNNSSGDLNFSTGVLDPTASSVKMVVKQNGNVGIGTTSPTKLLEVNGDIKVNGLTVGLGNGNTASNIVIGYQAGNSNTTGNNNSFIGYQAGTINTTGYNNSFIGYQAGFNNTTGYNNSFVGYQAGYTNSQGNYNYFLGFQAGYSNTTGYNNSFLGIETGINNITGNNNSFVGFTAGFNNTTGNYNSFVGNYAGYSNTTGSNNLYVGYNAGSINISGSSNTYLGVVSTGVTNGSSRSNMLAIGTQNNGVYIFGDSTGSIGIGTTAPSYKLDVSGTGRFTGNVGIGTAPTSNALEVSGNVNVNSGNIAISGGQYLSYGTGTINGYVGSGTLLGAGATSDFAIRATNNIAFGIGSSQKMTLASNGYLGLGTVTPAYVLDVNATANPLRLQGLATGAATDDILSSLGGVVRKVSVSQIMTASTFVFGNGSATTLPNATSTIMAFANTTDLASNMTSSTTTTGTFDTYTATNTGVVNISGMISFTPSATTSTGNVDVFAVTLNSGGAAIQTAIIGGCNVPSGLTTSNRLSSAYSGHIYLLAGQKLMLKVYQSTGSSAALASGSACSLTITQN